MRAHRHAGVSEEEIKKGDYNGQVAKAASSLSKHETRSALFIGY